MTRHLLTLTDWSPDDITKVIGLALRMKAKPQRYWHVLEGKKLLMMFAKPSLRTRLSFEAAMLELGGHAIFYDIATSPMSKKESVRDTARVSSLYVDGIMARLFEHEMIEELARHATVPVINGLTNSYHPCQALGDFMTIWELFGRFDVNLAYMGDAHNNVTHSLMIASEKLGAHMIVACPVSNDFLPSKEVMRQTSARVVGVPHVRTADVVYTDTWQSYQIPDKAMARRRRMLRPYQVNVRTFPPHAYFMHCLPAKRGEEVTADIIDGPRSVVLRQAENRKHVEKAILALLLGGV